MVLWSYNSMVLWDYGLYIRESDSRTGNRFGI